MASTVARLVLQCMSGSVMWQELEAMAQVNWSDDAEDFDIYRLKPCTAGHQ